MRICVIMDPIHGIKPQKDSSFALLLEAQGRGFPIYVATSEDLFLQHKQTMVDAKRLTVFDNPDHWFEIIEQGVRPLADFDLIFMRQDPPFNMDYIYVTYLLELAEQAGAKVVNKPQSLRDANEKFFTSQFPELSPRTMVAKDPNRLQDFLAEEKTIICKPLDGMGGRSIFKVDVDDPNKSVIFETMTNNGQQFIMAQEYLPQVVDGDKRILIIHGDAVPHALVRVPQSGETRANMVAGGSTHSAPLTKQEKVICKQLGPVLQKMGLVFVGIDVIGDKLTEINVTSPTGIRELDRYCNLNIAGELLKGI